MCRGIAYDLYMHSLKNMQFEKLPIEKNELKKKIHIGKKCRIEKNELKKIPKLKKNFELKNKISNYVLGEYMTNYPSIIDYTEFTFCKLTRQVLR